MQNLAGVNGTCYLCGDTTFKDVFVEDGIPVRRCQACGHVYSAYEQDEHYDGYWDTDVTAERLQFWDEAHRPVHSQFVDRFLPAGPGTLVDVGCGLGFFVDTVRKARPDWDVHGYELAAPAVEWSHRYLGLEGSVHHGLVEASGLAPGSVDVITLWDVVEHLTRPQPLLRYLRSLLAPDGVLFLQTPSVAFQLPKAWLTVAADRGVVPGKHYLAARDHVNQFSRRSLGRLADDCGFAPPRYEVLKPILAVGGQRSRPGELAKLALYGATRGLFAATGGRALANPTLFAFLSPRPGAVDPGPEATATVAPPAVATVGA